jgi:DNA transformation protein and related proteins
VSASAEFLDLLVDQMARFGSVTWRRMFGGAGLYADGLMFALVVDDTLYLKADPASEHLFAAEQLPAFTYATRDGRRSVMSYRRAPERCLDDPEEMQRWCATALEAARRARKPSGAAPRRKRRWP